jgi:flagellar biosynthesis protein FliR
VSLGVVLWAALRLFGLLRVQVLWREAVGPAWEAVAAGLAVCVALVVTPATADVAVATPAWWLVAGCEFLFGSVTGMLLSLPGQALLGAGGQGELLVLHGARGRLAALFAVACVAGGLAADLHRPLLVSLQRHLSVWPVGEPARWMSGLDAFATQAIAGGHAYLVLAFTLATPVLLAYAVIDLTLRWTVRGVATTPGDALRPWLATAAALVALGASWAAYPDAWQRGFGGP